MSLAPEGSNNLGISGKSINRGDKGKFYKYTLTRQAGSILFNPGKEAKDQHRTCWCHRGVTHADGGISVYRQKSGESARLHGVTTCKSVWTCPTCSAKICAVRQAELSEGMRAWIGQGGYVWLMTLTFPHEMGMLLSELLPQFSQAKAYFKNSKTYKRIFSKEKRKGSVSSLEITFGVHGWHPHQHDLVFAQPGTFGQVTEGEGGRQFSAVIEELKGAWFTALRKAGLCGPEDVSKVMDHGLDVRGGQYAAEYVAKFGREQKWGLSREVTMHAAKVGSDQKGAHPFQLLDWAAQGDGLAVEQFREYAEAFERKHMLSWSRGLKKELTGADELTDEEAADREMPEEESIGRIDAEGLSVLQSRRLLGHFLEFVAKHCTDPPTAQAYIDEYIAAVREIVPRTGKGDIKLRMWSRGFMHVDQEKLAA